MAFKTLKPVANSDVKYTLIDNSQTLSVGRVIIPGITSGVGVAQTGGGTTAGLLGVVLSIVGNKGKVLELDTFTSAVDNVTNALVRVAYIPLIRNLEFVVELDAAPETTAGSSSFSNFAVNATGLLLSESSRVVFGTVAAKQFFSYGLANIEYGARAVSCRYIGGAII